MGRTLDILKHTRTGPITLRIAPNLSPGSSSAVDLLAEDGGEIPFVEVGGPNHELHGSARVLAHPAAGKKKDDQKSKSAANDAGDTDGSALSSSIIDSPSSILDLPLSVVFQPLGSFHCIEAATGLIAPE